MLQNEANSTVLPPSFVHILLPCTWDWVFRIFPHLWLCDPSMLVRGSDGMKRAVAELFSQTLFPTPGSVRLEAPRCSSHFVAIFGPAGPRRLLCQAAGGVCNQRTPNPPMLHQNPPGTWEKGANRQLKRTIEDHLHPQ